VSTTSPEPRLIHYRPVKRRLRLSEVWTTRAIARMIAVRDLKVKYKQAALGPLWLLIAPLGMLAAVTVAFSGVTDVATGGVPYVLFALVGLVVWTYVQLSLTLGAQAIIANAALVRRSPIPRLALVTGTLLGNLPPVAVMLAIALVGTLASQGLPVQALLIPVLGVWLLFFTLGVTLLLAGAAARFRDTVSLMPLLVQAGIFVTPVGYSLAGAPANIKLLLTLNPVSGLIEAWRWSMFDLQDPNVTAIAVSLGLTLLLFTAGWYVFSTLETEFADVV
jgi:ABC-type polysaccharide/polyol phosphate export permease